MALSQRIAALSKRHQWLDNILAQEMGHLHPDDVRCAQIKKSKLRVKDELLALKNIERKISSIVEDEYLRTMVH